MGIKKVLAFDYGASSGRAVIGEFDGSRITLKEVHRFSNDPVVINGTMYWDILRLFYEMKQGMIKANLNGGFDTLAVDTWGVDFGLIDQSGNLLENPVHYRDKRTAGMIEKSFELLDKNRFYDITGIQFMELNTVFQLLYLAQYRRGLLDRTDTLLLMPDLFNYFLTGKKYAEYSIATTTQLLDAVGGDWSGEILDALHIPGRILPAVIPSGTIVGEVSPEICEEMGLTKVPDVIAVAGHDTQCAMASVPTTEEDFIFISCGTWSLFGSELDTPVINEDSYRLNLTNEGGYLKKVSFLKNIIGLWLVQESRRQWIREGEELNFAQLEQKAQEAKPLQCFIDPDAPEFVPSGNIPGRIRDYLRKTGQYVPQTHGEMVRCINESLALKYARTKTELESCTGKEYSVIHMVGGGIQSKMLCQLTANACQCKVAAGPVEATVYGNIALQLLASGEVQDLREARKIIAESEPVMVYEPEQSEEWKQAHIRYEAIFGVQ